MDTAGRFDYLIGNPEYEPEETPENHPQSLSSQLQEIYGSNGNGNSAHHDLNGGIRSDYVPYSVPYSEVSRYISQVKQPTVTFDAEGASLLAKSGYDTAAAAVARGEDIHDTQLNFPFAFSPEELQKNQMVRNSMARVLESLLAEAQKNRVYFPVDHPSDKHGYTSATAAACIALCLRDPQADIEVEVCKYNNKGQHPRLKITAEHAEEITQTSNAWQRYIEILMVTKNLESIPSGFNWLTDKLGQDIIALAYCGIPPSEIFASKKDRKKGLKLLYPGLAQRFEKTVETKGYDLSKVRKAYEETLYLFGHPFQNWDPKSTELWPTATPQLDLSVQPQSDFRPYDLFLENCAWQRLARNIGNLDKDEKIELSDVIICRKPTAVFDSVVGSQRYQRKSARNLYKYGDAFDSRAMLTIFMRSSVFVIPRSRHYDDTATFYAYGRSPQKGKMADLANHLGIRAFTGRPGYYV